MDNAIVIFIFGSFIALIHYLIKVKTAGTALSILLAIICVCIVINNPQNNTIYHIITESRQNNKNEGTDSSNNNNQSQTSTLPTTTETPSTNTNTETKPIATEVPPVTPPSQINSSTPPQQPINDDKPKEQTIVELSDSGITGFVNKENPKRIYRYKATRPGKYNFEVVDRTADSTVGITILSELKQQLESYTNAVSVVLEKSKLYLIYIDYYTEECSFKLRINIPDEIKDITGQTEISGEIRYKDQINQYTYKAPITGKYSFDLTSSVNGEIIIYDSKKIEKGIAFGNVTADLLAGQTYQILLMYFEKPCSYTLSIKYPGQFKNNLQQKMDRYLRQIFDLLKRNICLSKF